MVGARGRSFGFGSAALVACCGTVAMLVRAAGSPAGDIDLLGAAIGTSSFVVSAWGAWLTLRAARWQETDLADASARLAARVLAVEREARRQLLGDHDRAVDVRFVFRPSPAHSAAGADVGGSLAEVADYFRRLRPRRMVITGAPGAGKTVLAVQLLLCLLERRGADEPVPVRLSLASSEPHVDVEAWLARHLVRVYQLPRQTADALVAARRVLPVLDGLDGLDELDTAPCPGYGSRAARVLRALNAYQEGVRKAELLLTCRSETYDALEDSRVWAHDAARVEILPVAATEARAFLDARVDDPSRWSGVLDRLERDPAGPLAVGLATPWRLTLAATVHEQRDPATGRYARDPGLLLDRRLDSAEAVGTRLLDLFVPATAELFPGPGGARFDARLVREWLTTLARYLEDNAATGRTVAGHRLSGTDIVPSRLWPLAGTRRPLATLVVTAVAVSLTGTALLLGLLATQGPLLAPWPVLAALVILGMFTAAVWSLAWSDLAGEDHQYPQVRARPRAFVQRLTAALVTSGLLSGLLAALVAGQNPAASPVRTAAVFTGCAAALGLLFAVPLPGAPESSHPASSIRSHLVWGLAVPAAVSAEVLLAAAMSAGKGPVTVLALTAGGGLAGGLLFAPTLAPTGLWYAGLLLRTRRRSGRPLPWRLGRFLAWCYDAGLLRVAGTAYQFRHRELQDHLARQARPRP
ncbi:NACHT domain-containing protein [Streptomyces sp. CC224B]|uniref:NACHT domain-containing protein n=1 Tax=Streptomyces sp. CC224B TaxID=3044571 RepID=UPI0024A9ECBC|nr:NACHT domain-containing protein [Streptomyces sp. CC224B]